MHGDLLGIVLSVLLIVLCLGIAFLISRYGKRRLGAYCSEVARKFVHIGVSNWFFIYCFVFRSVLWPVLGLAAFTLMNAYMNVSGGFNATMGQQKADRQWGLVQYPVSIILLLLLQKAGLGDMSCVGCAVLGMGYGDGLAALMGHRFGKRKLNGGGSKTVVGFFTMFVVTLVVFMAVKLAFGSLYPLWMVALAGVAVASWAAIAEAITPFGLDNLSVPLVIFLMAGLV